ncbi:perivitellin-2 67 kDa subunit [Biomphalaria glabrata]|nr:perivitellin-2 67 kDa subunit [Biomphalaria glabrata]
MVFSFLIKFATAKQCTNPPPGIHKMVRGVDITRLDLVPLEDSGNDGFMSPVLNFTCDETRTWKTPEGKEYQLPDQIWHLSSHPGGWLSADVHLYKSYDDVRKSLSAEVGLSGTLWKFAFSSSNSFKKMQNTISNSSRYISDLGTFESALKAEFKPSWVVGMDVYAQKFVDNFLTGTFEANPSGYNRFITNFGTHYFTRGNFGGFIRDVIETRSDYFYSRSDREVESNAKASFLNVMSVTGSFGSSSQRVDQNFTNASTHIVRYYGGNTNLLAQNGVSEWQTTVDLDPWLFSGELKPISDLISDETKKQSMERAVENYVLKSYLGELERIVASARSKANDPVLNGLEARVIKMKNVPVLNLEDVETLSGDIQNEITAPTWFTMNTKLCFKWWATHIGTQCGGGADSLLCATPNSMTPFYQDNTDDRAGGCWMQWSIHSNGYPSWFEDVQICYKWEGDKSFCGGGADNLLCSGINNFTLKYLDDTDDRKGGCIMSWKLVVPDSVPLWMKLVNLCFFWYPDGTAGQCGHASSRRLCAVANQWTEKFMDDTDDQVGGCRMSWGLKLMFQ